MSSQSEKDLSCSICQDIFRDPVVLSCSHSFCKDCLHRWWYERRKDVCPLCREISLFRCPPRNLALKNVCETFTLERKQRSSAEPLCSLHAEKLKLFCLDHQEPVCLVCRDSNLHHNHRFRPIAEAVQDHRQELLVSLNPVKKKLNLFQRAKGKLEETAEHIRAQAQRTERRIMEEFKRLHRFLREEEEERLAALREEERRKHHAMREQSEALSRSISRLSDTIRATEEALRAADVPFLQKYKAARKRVQQNHRLDDPPPASAVLIDEAKHLGNLSYNIWTRMKEMVSYSPVILDPNTAHPGLHLSEDLTRVRLGPNQKLPQNPERFDQHLCVLGSAGFSSGTHSWDVEVGSGENWGVGVVKESVLRTGPIQTGFWGLCRFSGSYMVVSYPLPDQILRVSELKRVRVQLDWDGGRLSFFELESNKHLYTFRQTFSEKLFPFIGTNDQSPLKILPETEQPAVLL